jgi:hypothetical protein
VLGRPSGPHHLMPPCLYKPRQDLNAIGGRRDFSQDVLHKGEFRHDRVRSLSTQQQRPQSFPDFRRNWTALAHWASVQITRNLFVLCFLVPNFANGPRHSPVSRRLNNREVNASCKHEPCLYWEAFVVVAGYFNYAPRCGDRDRDRDSMPSIGAFHSNAKRVGRLCSCNAHLVEDHRYIRNKLYATCTIFKILQRLH